MHVLIFQHTDGEHPAAFGEHIAAAGDTMVIVRLHHGEQIPEMSVFDMLIVMGGPMDVWETAANPWLFEEKAAIAKWVSAGRPYLGICLGHQLLVDAMGGECAIMKNPEIGIIPIDVEDDALWGNLEVPLPVMQWHGVEAIKLPPNTFVIAANEACQTQTIRLGDRAWGVQFHPEIQEGLVTTWMSDPANRKCAVDWLGSEQAADDFAIESDAHVPDAVKQSAVFYSVLRSSAAS
jgi:GMP synthase-like glutamine amidotransferase